MKYLTVKAANCRVKQYPKGPNYCIGLVVKGGPEDGKWYNYYRTLTDATKEWFIKDMDIMGISNPDPEAFECDGRLFTLVWGKDAKAIDPQYRDRETVLSIRPLPKGTRPAPDDEIQF